MKTTGTRAYHKQFKTKNPFFFGRFQQFLGIEIFFLVLSWGVSLVFIVGELAGGGYMAVAVGIADI